MSPRTNADKPSSEATEEVKARAKSYIPDILPLMDAAEQDLVDEVVEEIDRALERAKEKVRECERKSGRA